MNNLQSPSTHPELGPVSPTRQVDKTEALTGGSIFFGQSPRSLDPMIVIKRGIADTPIEVAQQRASEAMGEIPAETT